jgi:hypothetical protein|eukprot:SAG25_NODE_148_length_13769_cov_14.642648_7_plen_134_part_00
MLASTYRMSEMDAGAANDTDRCAGAGPHAYFTHFTSFLPARRGLNARRRGWGRGGWRRGTPPWRRQGSHQSMELQRVALASARASPPVAAQLDREDMRERWLSGAKARDATAQWTDVRSPSLAYRHRHRHRGC